MWYVDFKSIIHDSILSIGGRYIPLKQVPPGSFKQTVVKRLPSEYELLKYRILTG